MSFSEVISPRKVPVGTLERMLLLQQRKIHLLAESGKAFHYDLENLLPGAPRVGEKHHYEEARSRIDECADQIYALAKMLELADNLDSLNPKIDPQAVAQIGKMIARDICHLTSILDELAPRGQSRL